MTSLALVPGLPLAGFALLALAGGRLSRKAIASVAVGSTALSFLVALVRALSYPGSAQVERIWSWIRIGEFDVPVSFRLDELSLVMILVVTFVGSFIHLYAAELMEEEEDYRRFFACMNLFMASMLILVLADNLLLLYLGWEGVGLCSYLLIGFWYRDPANGRAARKAFVVTRVGDAAMAVAFFLLFAHFSTLDIQELGRRAAAAWPVDSTLAVWAALLLLVGALGKSAQVPLQTWLPDAMAGPTPVSALIHAATMVAAGVYLIARTNQLFLLAPSILRLIGILGAVTLLYAAAAALAQRDIKRVLAYSTMSQVGYMFLALGAGAFSAAIFHFLTHAFFKALLFLGAGVVIAASHEEHDIFEMGGLRKRLPLTFWTFLAGASALAGVPLVTSGFFSKDWILSQTFATSPMLWAAGWTGAFLTALYSFRLVFLVFFGEPAKSGEAPKEREYVGLPIALPLTVLALLSLVAGFIELPAPLGDVHLFSTWMAPLAGAAPTGAASSEGMEIVLVLLASLASLAGLACAFVLYGRRRPRPEATRWQRWALDGFGFDALYAALFERPFLYVTKVNASDVIDSGYDLVARLATALHRLSARSENGVLRWYAGAIALGAVVAIALAVWA
jgi:NADH-quinone oxidoreductase subunit L